MSRCVQNLWPFLTGLPAPKIKVQGQKFQVWLKLNEQQDKKCVVLLYEGGCFKQLKQHKFEISIPQLAGIFRPSVRNYPGDKGLDHPYTKLRRTFKQTKRIWSFYKSGKFKFCKIPYWKQVRWKKEKKWTQLQGIHLTPCWSWGCLE